MLVLYHEGNEHPIQNTEYYVRELTSGLDEVILDISIHDPIYQIIAEEDNIVDRAGQRYLVKQIDAGSDMAKIICQLDLDDWRASMYVNYDSGSKTVLQQINAVKPTGWTVTDKTSLAMARTIHGDYTPLEICQVCTDVYSVYVRWDNKTKKVTIYPKAMSAPIGSFATRELNLKEINYKGKSNNFATRLYAYGKDGLSFNGKTIHGSTYNHPYVDNNTYSSRIICAYWQDDRYTDPESLYDDAVEKLSKLAVPERSYDCAIVDLQATNPELYNNLDFSLLTTATLIDDVKETAINYQVVERHVWPYHPELNEVIFDNAPLKITTSVIQIQDEIDNPNSTFSQIWDARVQQATDWLLDGDGYVVAVKGPDGEWKELLFMDTNDIATARQVIRINENGIGFSTTGASGPYTNAWTIDGKLNADFILTGTMVADRILGGTLTLGGKSGSTEDYYGVLVVKDTSNVEKVRLDKNGIKAIKGYIGNGSSGWTIGNTDIHNGCNSISSNTDGTYVGTDGFRNKSGSTSTTITGGKITSTDVELTGKITATSGYIGGSTGWIIDTDKIYKGTSSITSNTNGVYIGTDGIRNKNGTSVTTITSGKITSTDVELTGKVTATSGYIGGSTGWVIDTNKIYNGTSSISSNTDGTYVGIDGFRNKSGSTSTTITAGKITSTSVDLTGEIKATSGYIGQNTTNGWNIGSKSIYNGCSGMDNTGTGLYIGTDGIRCNGNVGQAPNAWIKISAGQLDAASLINAGGYSVRNSHTTVGSSLITADTLSATDSLGNATASLTGSSCKLTMTPSGGTYARIQLDGANGDIYTGNGGSAFTAYMKGSDGSVTAQSYKAIESGSVYSGVTNSIAWTGLAGDIHTMTVKNGIIVGLT